MLVSSNIQKEIDLRAMNTKSSDNSRLRVNGETAHVSRQTENQKKDKISVPQTSIRRKVEMEKD